jgi:hypothetical protein
VSANSKIYLKDGDIKYLCKDIDNKPNELIYKDGNTETVGILDASSFQPYDADTNAPTEGMPIKIIYDADGNVEYVHYYDPDPDPDETGEDPVDVWFKYNEDGTVDVGTFTDNDPSNDFTPLGKTLDTATGKATSSASSAPQRQVFTWNPSPEAVYFWVPPVYKVGDTPMYHRPIYYNCAETGWQWRFVGEHYEPGITIDDMWAEDYFTHNTNCKFQHWVNEFYGYYYWEPKLGYIFGSRSGMNTNIEDFVAYCYIGVGEDIFDSDCPVGGSIYWGSVSFVEGAQMVSQEEIEAAWEEYCQEWQEYLTTQQMWENYWNTFYYTDYWYRYEFAPNYNPYGLEATGGFLDDLVWQSNLAMEQAIVDAAENGNWEEAGALYQVYTDSQWLCLDTPLDTEASNDYGWLPQNINPYVTPGGAVQLYADTCPNVFNDNDLVQMLTWSDPYIYETSYNPYPYAEVAISDSGFEKWYYGNHRLIINPKGQDGVPGDGLFENVDWIIKDGVAMLNRPKVQYYPEYGMYGPVFKLDENGNVAFNEETLMPEIEMVFGQAGAEFVPEYPVDYTGSATILQHAQDYENLLEHHPQGGLITSIYGDSGGVKKERVLLIPMEMSFSSNTDPSGKMSVTFGGNTYANFNKLAWENPANNTINIKDIEKNTLETTYVNGGVVVRTNAKGMSSVVLKDTELIRQYSELGFNPWTVTGVTNTDIIESFNMEDREGNTIEANKVFEIVLGENEFGATRKLDKAGEHEITYSLREENGRYTQGRIRDYNRDTGVTAYINFKDGKSYTERVEFGDYRGVAVYNPDGLQYRRTADGTQFFDFDDFEEPGWVIEADGTKHDSFDLWKAANAAEAAKQSLINNYIGGANTTEEFLNRAKTVNLYEDTGSSYIAGLMQKTVYEDRLALWKQLQNWGKFSSERFSDINKPPSEVNLSFDMALAMYNEMDEKGKMPDIYQDPQQAVGQDNVPDNIYAEMFLNKITEWAKGATPADIDAYIYDLTFDYWEETTFGTSENLFLSKVIDTLNDLNRIPSEIIALDMQKDIAEGKEPTEKCKGAYQKVLDLESIVRAGRQYYNDLEDALACDDMDAADEASRNLSNHMQYGGYDISTMIQYGLLIYDLNKKADAFETLEEGADRTWMHFFKDRPLIYLEGIENIAKFNASMDDIDYVTDLFINMHSTNNNNAYVVVDYFTGSADYEEGAVSYSKYQDAIHVLGKAQEELDSTIMFSTAADVTILIAGLVAMGVGAGVTGAELAKELQWLPYAKAPMPIISKMVNKSVAEFVGASIIAATQMPKFSIEMGFELATLSSIVHSLGLVEEGDIFSKMLGQGWNLNLPENWTWADATSQIRRCYRRLDRCLYTMEKPVARTWRFKSPYG